MIDNIIKRKWNKETLYSIGSFILAIFITAGFLNCLKNQDSSGVTIFGQNFKFWLPVFLILNFLHISLIFGIKSIRRINAFLEKGRLLGIIFTTLSFFAIIIFIISIFEYII